jgi:endo-1,4-beta-xylanase
MKKNKVLKGFVSACLMLGWIFAVCGCGTEKNSESAKETSAETSETTTMETTSKAEENKSYYEIYNETGELPSLAEVYKDYFKIGVALCREDLDTQKRKDCITSQFNSMTCGNEMKADFTLDRNATIAAGDETCPVVNMDKADVLLDFAKENGLKMRGHTLVWHSQTPRWLFTVGYDNSPDAPFVTREVMLARMENYIKQVMDHVNTKYPGLIYAWDVVNEAIDPGEGRADGLRTKNAYWYQVVGEDYIEQAFAIARKYAAPEQKLFYNDYNTYEKSKLSAIYNLAKKLKEKNLIDGIGMQSHIQLSYPSLMDYEYAVTKYSELGVEVQVTELDIDTTDNTKETQDKLASRYKRLLLILKSLKESGKANITSVTFWGLTDDRSWLNNDGKPSWPLLFDKDIKPKSAYFGVLQDPSVALN